MYSEYRSERSKASGGDAQKINQLLSALPRGISRLQPQELPDVPPMPAPECPKILSSPGSTTSLAVSVTLPLAPHVQYFLDLRSLLFAKQESHNSIEVEDLEVEDLDVRSS